MYVSIRPVLLPLCIFYSWSISMLHAWASLEIVSKYSVFQLIASSLPFCSNTFHFSCKLKCFHSLHFLFIQTIILLLFYCFLYNYPVFISSTPVESALCIKIGLKILYIFKIKYHKFFFILRYWFVQVITCPDILFLSLIPL